MCSCTYMCVSVEPEKDIEFPGASITAAGKMASVGAGNGAGVLGSSSQRS